MLGTISATAPNRRIFGSLRLKGIGVFRHGGAAALLLEQTIKCRPRIVRPLARRRRSLFLPRYPHLIRRALIPRILLRHPLLHRLHAFKPAAGIEIHALLARMQLEPALRTLPVRCHPLQDRPTLRAPRHRPRSRQIHGLRSKCMIPSRRPALALWRRLADRLPPWFTIAILISWLPVFRHNPSPTTRPVLSPLRAPGASVAPASRRLSRKEQRAGCPILTSRLLRR